MSRGVPYIRFFGDDWLSGTSDLSLEERGALITVVALTAATGKMPVADYSRLSRRLGTTKGRAEKVIKSLVELGKIELVGGCLKNGRAVKELKKAQEFSRKQSERRKQTESKNDEKGNENNGGDVTAVKPRINQPEPEPKPDIYYSTLGAVEAKDIWLDRLNAAIDAARPRLQKTSIAFLTYADLKNWCEGKNAADFDMDVLPALAEVAARDPSHKVTSWRYFKNAVFDKRDARIAPNPEINITNENRNDRTNYQASKSDRVKPTTTIRQARGDVLAELGVEFKKTGSG